MSINHDCGVLIYLNFLEWLLNDVDLYYGNFIHEDTGLHKEIGQGVKFPNATVQCIQDWFPELLSLSSGQRLVDRFLELKKIKDIIG